MSEAEGTAAQPSLLPSSRRIAGRYRVAEVIGEGAQSVVYRAVREAGDGPATPRSGDVPVGTAVALKVIHRHLSGSAQVRKRFLREASILRGLDLHGEHIVKLLDVLEDDGLLMIALEHVDGTSLEATLAARGPLGLDEAIEIALQISAALGVAHANGVVHRDLKPANVLLERPRGGEVPTSSGRGIRVKVVDFGLGKVLHGPVSSTGLTEQGMIFGTPEYMAPEQARGEEADARADLYALGIILYEMLVGEVPFRGRSAVATMTAHLAEPVPSLRKARPEVAVSSALEALLRRALAKDPGDRFTSAREMAEAIAAARDERLVIAPSGASGVALVGLEQVDTDLHLERQELGQARTLRADEVAELAAAQRRGASAAAPRPTEAPPTVPSAEGPPPARRAPVIIDEESTVVSGEPPSRTGYLWVVVAVVAALVGVAIGAYAGMR